MHLSQLPQAQAREVHRVEEVNAWIKEATNGEIPSLLSPDAVLGIGFVNALFFKGLWSLQFDETLTSVGRFHSPNKGAIEVMSL